MSSIQTAEIPSSEPDPIVQKWIELEQAFPQRSFHDAGFVNCAKRILNQYCYQDPKLTEARRKTFELHASFQRAGDVCNLVQRRDQCTDELMQARRDYNAAKAQYKATGRFRKTRFGRLLKGVVLELFPNLRFAEDRQRANLIEAANTHKAATTNITAAGALIQQEAGRPDVSVKEAQRLHKERGHRFETQRAQFRDALVASLDGKREAHPAYGRMASFARKANLP